MCTFNLVKEQNFKGEFANFVIGLSGASKYDIIWTENDNVIDNFIPEIMRVQHVLGTLWTLERQNSGRKQSIKFLTSVRIMTYLGASDRPINKTGELLIYAPLDVQFGNS